MRPGAGQKDHGYLALILFALAMMATVRFIVVGHDLQADTWLALVDARGISSMGLPHHDFTSVMLYGRQIVDQQWLAQLAMYGLQQLGGLGLLAATSVLLLTGSLAAGVWAAGALGASTQRILLVLPLAWWLSFSLVGGVRPEAFVLPLFVGLIYILASDSIHPGARVYLCLPVLVLWANLHGSVTLGAALTSLRGLVLAWERRHRIRELRQLLRPALLVLLAPACVLATPYGVDTISYYRATVFNPALGQFISEWQPLIRAPVFFVPVVIALPLSAWALWRDRGKLGSWPVLALLLIAGSAFVAQRNAIWFGLGLLVMLPPAFKPALARPRPASLRWIDRALAASAVGAIVAGPIITVSRPSRSFQSGFPEGALVAVTRATTSDPSLRVFTDVYVADWLLWRDSRLIGKVAYDDHLELLSGSQFAQLDRLKFALGRNWAAVANGYRLIVLDPRMEPDAVRAFESQLGSRVLYRGDDDVILLEARSA